MLTPLQFLNLPDDATVDQINTRLRNLLRAWHPDKCDKPNAAFIFNKIMNARTALSEGDHAAEFPALISLEQRLPSYEVDGCECGWFFTNRWLCEECGQFRPGVRRDVDASWKDKESFWNVARKICVDKGVSTDKAKRLFALLFGHEPKTKGRHLLRA